MNVKNDGGKLWILIYKKILKNSSVLVEIIYFTLMHKQMEKRI